MEENYQSLNGLNSKLLKMKQEHTQFYTEFINGLQSNSLSIFAGAGLSKSAGYVDWKGLLKGIATDLGLNIDNETDLISIAQYNVNKIGGRSMLNQQIINEFNEDIDSTENHKILARLPIHTYWTTNYDNLLEKSLKEAKRIADVKHSVSQLNTAIPRRDAVVYKMHGDYTLPNEAVIDKDDYENYSVDKIPFINLLSGDLGSKRFVFMGFSFTDPNLDYILSRVRIQMRGSQNHHWYFVKRIAIGDYGIKTNEELIYQRAKQEHFIADLKRRRLQPVYIDSYQEITSILKELESIYKKKTVFISGSAEDYGVIGQEKGIGFIHNLSGRLIKEGFRVVNGFGLGVGSAVINGALEEIYKKPEKYSTDLLIVRPFPQFASGTKSLPDLWNEYRREMLKLAGVSVYIFGNKLNPDEPQNRSIINAPGVKKEFEIAEEYGIIQIPVKATGFMSDELSTIIEGKNFNSPLESTLYELYKNLHEEKDLNKIIDIIITILKEINK